MPIWAVGSRVNASSDQGERIAPRTAAATAGRLWRLPKLPLLGQAPPRPQLPTSPPATAIIPAVTLPRCTGSIAFLPLALLATSIPATAAPSPPVAPDDATVTIAWAGDVHLGRAVAEGLARPGAGDPFRRLRPHLAAADLRIANLEGQLTTAPRRRGEGHDLTGHPAHVPVLALAGLDLVGVANNHATDNGRAGLAESLAVLHEAGIATVGGGVRAAAYRPALFERHGLRIAVLAFNLVPGSLGATDTAVGVAAYDTPAMARAVRAARSAADLVFVMPHWGVELAPVAAVEQRRMARYLVDAGADAILGHHPHVVQEVAWLARPSRRPALVAYSLGNFVFDSLEPDAQRGAVLWTRADRDGVLAFRALPLRTTWLGTEPLLAPRAEASLRDRLWPWPAARSTPVQGDGLAWYLSPGTTANRNRHLSVSFSVPRSYHGAALAPCAH